MLSNEAQFPFIDVTANGLPVLGVVDLEITNDSFMGADRYRLTAALDVSGYNIWSSNAIDIQIGVGLNGGVKTFIVGPVDTVEVDVGRSLLHVEGRDLTARFIEARTQETFQNQTASEIAIELASRRGLAANITSTTLLVGRDFGGDHSGVTLDQHSSVTTEWDLLVKLAVGEGFDVWVNGGSLNFGPPQASAMPLVLNPSQCVSLSLHRTLALCGRLQVDVKSWDCRAQAGVSGLATAGATGDISRNYVVIQPNLTATAATRVAQRVLSQMTQNARTIYVEMPGDITTEPRQTLVLADTGTDFDGTYVITSVERRLSFERGFEQTLQARIPRWITS